MFTNLKLEFMFDILISLSKVSVKSIFTAKKYDSEILDEDLQRILFIRNLLEESLEFIMKNYKEIDTDRYLEELKNYAIELFIKQCAEAISEEEKVSEDFNPEEDREEDRKFFNYVYSNLKYPD